MIASTVPVDRKQSEHPLQRLLDTIRLFKKKSAAPEHPPEADPELIKNLGFDPEHPPIPDVAAGSFERAMRTLNAPPKG